MIWCHRRHQQSPPIKSPNFHQQPILLFFSWGNCRGKKDTHTKHFKNVTWRTCQHQAPLDANSRNPQKKKTDSQLSPNNGTKISPRVICGLMSQKRLPFGLREKRDLTGTLVVGGQHISRGPLQPPNPEPHAIRTWYRGAQLSETIQPNIHGKLMRADEVWA